MRYILHEIYILCRISFKMIKKVAEKLTREQYHILREKGTEMPFTGKLLYNKESGVYRCAGCNSELFSSDSKFESGTGWPSFDKPIKEAVRYIKDKGQGMLRTEIICSNCGGHLGHVFNDGPTPTGERYCLNSCALDFKKGKKKN